MQISLKIKYVSKHLNFSVYNIFSRCLCFCFQMDGRTDTMRENNDYLFGRGMVGKSNIENPKVKFD